MTDTEKLRELMDDSGHRDEYFAAGLHISLASLRKKINNVVEFKPSEIKAFAKLLGIKSLQKIWELFFAPNVDSESTEKGA